MLGKVLHLKTTALIVFFLWLVKFFKKLGNDKLVDCLEKCGLMSGDTRAISCDISQAFERVWHPGLLHKIRDSFGSGRSSQEYSVNAGGT